MKTSFFSIAVGLAIGNFLFALLVTKEYGKAVEHTFFQCVALFLAYLNVLAVSS